MKPIEWDIRREGRRWSHDEFGRKKGVRKKGVRNRFGASSADCLAAGEPLSNMAA